MNSRAFSHSTFSCHAAFIFAQRCRCAVPRSPSDPRIYSSSRRLGLLVYFSLVLFLITSAPLSQYPRCQSFEGMGWSRSAQRQRNKRLSSIAAAVSAGYLFILAILAFLANSVLNQYRTATTAAKADATAFNNPESVATGTTDSRLPYVTAKYTDTTIGVSTAIASSFIVLGAISLGVFVKNGWYSPFTSTWLVIVVSSVSGCGMYK